ncbi:MAG: hypothetical protein ABIL58_27735 [Pseudomonadota bacterium]
MPTQADKLKFVAEKLGWKYHRESNPWGGGFDCWFLPDGTTKFCISDWLHSVDALLAEGGPVEWCEECDCAFEIKTDEVILYDTCPNDGYYIISAFNVSKYTGTLAERIASALLDAVYKAMGGKE